eukprot:CAMPEP_0178440122 /NCGR_PEP_ID=MMETSP0689_2-20121128/36570_1 /TAXON_ID=160604 /ORGANISM="Amphidinium massartii, Strain CS-259" /LENGTH=704 /DNA_ID=CAMNT_0020062795 /DNA_START=94 /DNA_END=2205 /DNA_ORIENTATION=+
MATPPQAQTASVAARAFLADAAAAPSQYSSRFLAAGSRPQHPSSGSSSASAGSRHHEQGEGSIVWPLSAGLAAGALLKAAGVREATARGQKKKVQRRAVATKDKAILSEVSPGKFVRDDIRNLAIIAHVDHGKTTLTDALMQQTGKKEVASMDSNQLEAERGITILAKNAAISYNGTKVNLIDTPGHADFGGEVERILNMADGCLLLVDAQEGPMPQTKFVLRKALDLQKRVLVCINKVDKPAARPDWVLDTTFDLFTSLGADDELCDFPVSYASGIQGKACTEDPEDLQADLTPLLEQIVAECPKPVVKTDQPLQMMVSNLDYDEYKGRVCIGRVISGTLKIGDKVGFQYGEDGEMRKSTISYLWAFNNNERVEVDEISAGDICAFAGMDDVSIGDTVVDLNNPLPLPPLIVEEPTVTMEFGVNVSPLAGKSDGAQKLTGSQLGNRLQKEVMTNLALRVEPGSTNERFLVKGRGTLQLGILVESMRREGFELMIGAPKVIMRKDPETGVEQEPYEECVVEVDAEYQGAVMEEMTKKGAVMKNMDSGAVDGTMVMTFEAPTQNLIGMQGRLLQRTRGSSVTNSRFSHWGETTGEEIRLREKGSIVTMAGGTATAYAIEMAEKRGQMFITPGEEVYAGMCVGIHSKDKDLEVNICKDKGVSNVRAGGSQVTKRSTTGGILSMSLDDYLGHMDVDEMLEVTPEKLR